MLNVYYAESLAGSPLIVPCKPPTESEDSQHYNPLASPVKLEMQVSMSDICPEQEVTLRVNEEAKPKLKITLKRTQTPYRIMADEDNSCDED